MCGINGIIAKNNRNKNEVNTILNTMNDLIIHRGPDEDGLFSEENDAFSVGMGMRRLSIIDLSSGKQPIFSDDKQIVIVFNGFSAPKGGITIIGSAIRSGEGCTNMIWRGIRFRNGYLSISSLGSLNTTCLGFRGASDVIVDRCSFAYAKNKYKSSYLDHPKLFVLKVLN